MKRERYNENGILEIWWPAIHRTWQGSADLRIIMQSRSVAGVWSRERVAEAYADGSGILNQLLGTAELDAALAEFAAEQGQPLESFRTANLDCLLAAHERAKADRAKMLEAAKGSPCYVRFGKLPASGRSWNHRDGYAEAGVSCYRGFRANGKIYIQLSGTDQVSAMLIVGSAHMYIVNGREIGVGADGEPLLTDCRAKKCNLPYEVITAARD